MGAVNPLYTDLKRLMPGIALYGTLKIAGATNERQRQAIGTFINRWNDGLYHRAGEPDTTFRVLNHENRLLLIIRVE